MMLREAMFFLQELPIPRLFTSSFFYHNKASKCHSSNSLEP
ncbi:hypothetical protein SAMN05661012_05202 [Chitinophaga sancti]|uniref:Uncharacterized protein n=1 Tax=Chitinophaga sancti TaxID=1004 RepID=A0A1K1SD66_9BACT|nr:hypothetical protein SAMN05661012_05202 [Chitinophaga sancti]